MAEEAKIKLFDYYLIQLLTDGQKGRGDQRAGETEKTQGEEEGAEEEKARKESLQEGGPQSSQTGAIGDRDGGPTSNS